MLYPKGTIVKAPNGDIGIVTNSQEHKPPFAAGCYVKFLDGTCLFMSEVCKALNDKEIEDFLIGEQNVRN